MFTDNLVVWVLGLAVFYLFLNKQRTIIVEAAQPSMSPPMSSNPNEAKVSRPTRHDVYHVAFLLEQKLPPELVPQIMDYAEYWLKSSTSIRQDMEASDIRILGRRSNYITSGATYLSTLPIGKVPGEEENGIALVGQYPVRKVVFTVESQDQGWSDFPQDHGTEQGSWTWFEAAVREPNQPVYQDLLRARQDINHNEQRRDEMLEPPQGREVCRNVHAGREWRRKSVAWGVSDEDEEIREWIGHLSRGQVVDLTVWARYPGWRNRVRSAQIDIYFAAVR